MSGTEIGDSGGFLSASADTCSWARIARVESEDIGVIYHDDIKHHNACGKVLHAVPYRRFPSHRRIEPRVI